MSGTISQNKKAAKTLRLHDFYSHVVVSLLLCLMLLPIEPDFKVCVLWLLFGQLIILIRCTIKVRKSVKPLVAFLILVLYQPSPFSSDFGIRQSTIIAYNMQFSVPKLQIIIVIAKTGQNYFMQRLQKSL